jgi:hypothetical protein
MDRRLRCPIRQRPWFNSDRFAGGSARTVRAQPTRPTAPRASSIDTYNYGALLSALTVPSSIENVQSTKEDSTRR